MEPPSLPAAPASQPPPVPVPPRRASAWPWILTALLSIALVSSLLVTGLLAAALAGKKAFGGATDTTDRAVDEFPDFEETWSFGKGNVKAVHIAVTGVIMRGGEETLLGVTEDRIESILAQIRAAAADDEVKAILLEVDSPGGGITASDEIYEALARFNDSTDDRTVLVFIRDMAASGGYYVAMAGDYLLAEPTSIIGSIGVIMQSLNWKALSERIGLKDVTIKSGANKDLLNPFEEVRPEQRALLQQMIDAMYERFLGIVVASREIEEEKLRPLADGRILDADAALEAGLIDEIGYWDDAVERLAELLETESVKIVRYDRPDDIWSAFARLKLPALMPRLLGLDPPRMLYLWQP